VLLFPPLVTAVIAAVAVYVVSGQARIQVLWCGMVAVVAVALVAVEAARRGRIADGLRARLVEQQAAYERRLAVQNAETTRLATEHLPAALKRIETGRSVDDVLSEVDFSSDLNPDFLQAHRRVLRSTLSIVSSEQGLRDVTQQAFVNIARRVQAIVSQQARDLRQMEDKHGNDRRVFADLLQIDHGNALIGRLADSIAVLGGARPGRQWGRNIPLYSVLRGAMSRILDYPRVDLYSVAEVAIVGPAVEPLIHAVAELLDNATRYSPPQTCVHMTAVEVQTGIAIEIEDGGVGLTAEAHARAEGVLRQEQNEIDLDDLGETPRLGLAVVGRLCKAYKFQVALRSSAYGGARAVLIVPSEYITTAPARGRAHGIGAQAGTRSEETETTAPSVVAHDHAPAKTARPSFPAPSARSRAAAQPMPTVPDSFAALDDDDEVIVTEWTDSGLPQRRRKPGTPPPMTLSRRQAAAKAAAAEAEAQAPKPAQPPGMWLDDFMSNLKGEASPSAADRNKTDEQPDEGDKQ
jgi:signal transduction histidine kinase